MKIIVISDSHGHIANIQHVLGFAKKIKAEAIVHAADWNNLDSVNSVLNFNIPTYSVLGNADIDPNVERVLRQKSEKFSPDKLKIELDNKKIGIIHSFRATDDWYRDLNIVFCGHRHSPEERLINDVKIVRPGGLVEGIHFVVYDTKSGEVEFIHE